MKKYEYKVIHKPIPAVANAKKFDEISQKIENELCEIGADGWQFIQWKNSFMIFKRQIL